MKRCTRCKKLKDESEFGKQSTRKDGLRCWCKKCECDYIHKYYRRNKKDVKRFRRYEEYHRVVDGVRHKRCKRCKRWKPETDFHKLRAAKDGLKWDCKKCTNEEARKHHERRLAVRN